MIPILFTVILASSTLLAVKTHAQVPALPNGAQTHWIISQPKEIVGWVLFDPTTVESRLPTALRFITVEELASVGIGWAVDYLSNHPGQGKWGISFLEIARMRTFMIDGYTPDWPEHGAAALWFARVASSNPEVDLGPGQPFLALEFWMSDSLYVVAMREKGHYATYGNVKLYQDNEKRWRGIINVDGLNAVAECMPSGSVTGGVGSAGMQAIYPPRSDSLTSVVRVAFAGHRIQQCDGNSSWSLQGNHPLASGIVLGHSEFQFGYELQGGACEW
jgi:hypothetical protein